MGPRDPIVLHEAHVVPDVSSIGRFGVCRRCHGRAFAILCSQTIGRVCNTLIHCIA